MQIILCTEEQQQELTDFYNKIVKYLEANINYPLWVYADYPSKSTVKGAIEKRHQYAYIENGKIINAFVLNDDPGGKYENAKIEFERGQYLIIHTLATDYECYGKGIASKAIQFCIEKAKKEGYKAIYADIVPTNTPSRNLFKKNGFTYLGDFDLERQIKNIPLFSLYELKL